VLTIYNSLGQVVKTLLNENLSAGTHQVSFDAVTLPSGIYYYKLEAGTYSSVKRMLLVK
jgi:flagellar hook assembly protein FlgD